jgi:hypothetical protein
MAQMVGVERNAGEICVRWIGIHHLKVLNLELEPTLDESQRSGAIMTGKIAALKRCQGCGRKSSRC